MTEVTRNAAGQETDQRPWGSYTVLDDEPTFKVKRIEVLPGKRLSYQRGGSGGGETSGGRAYEPGHVPDLP